MARRLTLNTAGIKSPLDIGEPAAGRDAREPAAGQPGADSPSSAPPRRSARAGTSSTPQRHAHSDSDRASFYGAGRPLQTAIALEPEHLALLEQLARESGLSLNAIAVAALHDGLPATDVDARRSIVEERVARAGHGERRIEYNLRIPTELRARVDRLTRDSRERLPRAARADLVNAALRRSLPRDARAATVLVAAFARNLELSSTR
jgi:hypothetical protein